MPRFQETSPQALASNTRPQKPMVGSLDTPCCRELRYGIHPPPIEAEEYEISIDLVMKIQESKFLGTKLENPYDHLVAFERLCDLIRVKGVPHDSIKLLLFSFSLGERASQWERMLPSHLVKTWVDCKNLFLNKFYPIQRTIQARRDILNFKQGSHESFGDAWNRLQGYTRDCPHHGFEKGAILSIFYRGVEKENRWTLDVASKGRFYNLNVDEGELLVENFARSFESYMEWDDATPLEEPCQDSNLQLLRDELDMRERLIDALQREACLFHEERQSEVTLEVMNGSDVQEGELLEQWPSYEVQEDQQDLELMSMLQQILTEQAKMEARVEALSSSMMHLDHQMAQEHPSSSEPIIDANIAENEKFLLELEKALYGPQHEELMVSSKAKVEEKVEVEAPRVEYMGSYSTMHVVSPPKASLKKKESRGERALGYGNDEEALALDGSCLDSLFSTTMEKVESSKGKCTKTKEIKSHDNHPIILEPSSSTMTLTPWKYEDGAIEYKVKCKGRTKPFAKVKAILSTELKDRGLKGIQEVMSKVLLLELKDPPWSVHTSLSHT